MKKIWIFILWLYTLLFVWNISQADENYEYSDFNITADILTDWTINIKENITANFFVEKHGIIRKIPLNYSVWWKKFHIEVSNINVEWYNFTETNDNKNFQIKIWDTNKTIVWKHTYPISYSVYWLVRNFSWKGYAEIYWNLIWNEFDTNINKVRAELNLPKTYTWFTNNDFLITTDWSSKTIDWFEWKVDRSQWNKIIVTYNKKLPANQWITLAIKFPNNYFEFDHERQAKIIGHLWSIRDTIPWNIRDIFSGILLIILLIIIISSPIILLVLLIKFIIRLVKNHWEWIKKDFKEKYPIIIQYNPPKWLNSAEVWILLHRYEDPKDTFSLIYKWASEWFIKIQSWKKGWDVTLTKIKKIPEKYPEYEKFIFNRLFFEDELILDNKTYLYSKLTDSWIEDYWIKKGRFTRKKEKGSIWCLFIILFFIWTPILSSFSPVLGVALFFILFCIILSLWKNLEWKTLEETEQWAKLISHILGYKQFLKTCDENKLRTFLEQDPLYFDKILPYAIVFGLETSLIKKIRPIMEERNITPTRYSWDLYTLTSTTNTINRMAYSEKPSSHSSWWYSSYSSSDWFDSWSSFDSWWSDFDSWWGWGWWGGSSW